MKTKLTLTMIMSSLLGMCLLVYTTQKSVLPADKVIEQFVDTDQHYTVVYDDIECYSIGSYISDWVVSECFKSYTEANEYRIELETHRNNRLEFESRSWRIVK